MKNIAIIQARMGSTRLPGKALKLLGGRPIIEWVVKRVCAARLLNGVVVAIPDNPSNDILARYLGSLQVLVFRGHEEDVLGRFYQAAANSNATNVIRICADNPLVAPEEIDRLVRYFIDQQPLDYAFNHIPRLNNHYPDGFGAEIFSSALLQWLADNVKDTALREHVTLYLWKHPEKFKIGYPIAPQSIATDDDNIKLDVDTGADLFALNQWISYEDINASAENIVMRLKARRCISTIDP